jgi:hypothetical protein
MSRALRLHHEPGLAAHRIIVTHIFINSGGVQRMRMTKAMRQAFSRDEKLVRPPNLSPYFYEAVTVKFH